MSSSRFRWVFCQLDAIRQCLPSSLRRTLEELPESLDETYERIITDIKKGIWADAYRMLQCLTVAIRPLTVAELAEILALDFDGAKQGIPELNSNWRWEDHEQAVLSTCSSLITIVPGHRDPVVQFSHFSVKEFLLSNRLTMSTKDISRFHIIPEDANALIASACLGVLLRDPVHLPGYDNGATTAPLARYAAENWVSHAKVENAASCIREGVRYLFDPDKPYFAAWVNQYDNYPYAWNPPLKIERLPGAAPLFYAAFLGFQDIVESLTSKYPQYINAISGEAGTALHSASHIGHLRIVCSLLKSGADVDSRGVWNSSPLQLALTKGHSDVVQCLLDHGADANVQDDFYDTPLTIAAVHGNPEIVRILLHHSADANYQDESGLTPLHRALLYGASKGDYPEIVRLLLKHGANPNILDNNHRTPLHLVSSWGLVSLRHEVAHILLVHGADVGVEDDEGQTPLQGALASEQLDLVQLLSEYSTK